MPIADLGCQLVRRVDRDVHLPPEHPLRLANRVRDLGERGLTHDHEVQVARPNLLPSRHRAEDECYLDPFGPAEWPRNTRLVIEVAGSTDEEVSVARGEQVAIRVTAHNARNSPLWSPPGKVWLDYTAPAALKARYDVSGRDKAFAKMTGALDKMTNAALKAE